MSHFMDAVKIAKIDKIDDFNAMQADDPPD
jgi:hypothetical protein